MKKSLLLLILSTVSLVGCSVENKNSKSSGPETDKPLPIEDKPIPFPIEGDQDHQHTDLDNDHLCDTCKEKISECVDVDHNNLCDICGENLGTEENTEITVTIPMCGESFSNSFSVGTDLSADYSYTPLLTYLSSFGEENYINAYSGYCLNTNDYDNCRYFTLGTGYFAKGKFQSGSLTVCSSVSILAVEVVAKAYMNSYPGYGAQAGTTVYQPDYPASILLDGTETSLAVEENASETVSKTISKDYSATGGVKQFTIESKNARVFVESIKITWKGQNS